METNDHLGNRRGSGDEPHETEVKGIRPIKYSGGNDLSYYTYLKQAVRWAKKINMMKSSWSAGVFLGVEEEPACWKNQKLFCSFIRYYSDQIAGRDTALCMIEGKLLLSAVQHPKGIITVNGNAKLISANDSSGFTYRGRFSAGWQAATVSYTVS